MALNRAGLLELEPVEASGGASAKVRDRYLVLAVRNYGYVGYRSPARRSHIRVLKQGNARRHITGPTDSEICS